jgi:HK97 gp10 family phage protein
MAFRHDNGLGDASARLRGANELLAMLKRLPTQIREDVSYKALLAGSEVMLDKAREQVPVGKAHQRRGKGHKPGTLRASLQVYPGQFKGKSITFAVGAAFLESTFGEEAFYGGFIEFGHRLGSRKLVERTRIKSTKRTGKRGRPRSIIRKHDTRKLVPPNPFLRRAFNAGKAAAVDKVAAVIRSEVVRLAHVGIGSL